MKVFIARFITIFAVCLAPQVVLISLFFIEDPFRLNTYPPYIEGNHHINRGVATTNGFLANKDVKSIILGNSRSISLRCDDWQATDSTCTNCYHFDASGENLFGFQQKAQLISTQLNSLERVLIILDDESIQTDAVKPKEFPFVRHPAYKELPIIEFYWVFLKQYLNPKYQWAHLSGDRTLGEHWVQEFSYANCSFNPTTGDYITAKEYWIQEDSTNYYSENWVFDYKPLDSYYEIQEESIVLLETVINTFESMGAKCSIIFQPRFLLTHPSPQSLDRISARFPQTTIFDASHFSIITENPGLWYETSHFRPMAGRMIFKSIKSNSLRHHALQLP